MKKILQKRFKIIMVESAPDIAFMNTFTGRQGVFLCIPNRALHAWVIDIGTKSKESEYNNLWEKITPLDFHMFSDVIKTHCPDKFEILTHPRVSAIIIDNRESRVNWLKEQGLHIIESGHQTIIEGSVATWRKLNAAASTKASVSCIQFFESLAEEALSIL